MQFEEFLSKLKSYQEHSKLWLLNPERQIEFEEAYREIRDLIKAEDDEATIDCAESEIDDGSAVIRITSDWITVREIEMFCHSIRKADNFEIYPMTNGKLAFNITFQGLKTPYFKGK